METPQETLKHLSHAPGVYIYRNHQKNIIYIGKAKDLKKRVSQYWKRDDAVGPKTRLLVSQIVSVETIETASELDALLLEAKLIHDHLPKYNVISKDDKSPLYILLTLSEELPHVLTMRRSDLPSHIPKKDALFGPFQSAGVVRSLLRQLRRSIPYCTQRRRTGQPCFYSHIGLCSPCPSEIIKLSDLSTRKSLTHLYRTNIIRLKQILNGKSSTVLKDLEYEMLRAAQKNRFEEATRLRNHIQNLYGMLSKRYDPMLYLSENASVEDIYAEELSALQKTLLPYLKTISKLHRIECIDISNTMGAYATGSLVILTDGRKDPAQYRRFRIKRKNVPNDFAMIEEVITRRFSHPEWPIPDLLVIDGGKGQVSVAHETLIHLSKNVPLIGLAKRFEEVVVPLSQGQWKILRLDLTSPALHVVERIRDEAHRFALSYHRLLRKKSFV